MFLLIGAFAVIGYICLQNAKKEWKSRVINYAFGYGFTGSLLAIGVLIFLLITK